MNHDDTRPLRLWRPAVLFLLALAALLAACGSHGTAPSLGAPAHVSLSAQGKDIGTATLTPFHATRVVAYLNGQQIPYTGAKTPVQLRKERCDGPVLAALTENAPGPTDGQGPLVRPDPAGGANVALAASDSTWVAVLDHAGDTSAPIIACGQPLSDRRQNFNLVEVANSRNYPLGFAQIDPIVGSRVDVSLERPPVGEVAWAIRAGGCAGSEVARGRFSSGATRGGIVFAAPDTSQWWLRVAGGDGGLDACGKVVS
jgi:hypothetical protein